MSECGETSSMLCETHIKVQRTLDEVLNGACIALSPDDLSFVDYETKWLAVEKKKIAKGLTVLITEEMPDPCK